LTLKIELLKIRLLLFIAGQLATIASQTKGLTVPERSQIANDFERLQQEVRYQVESDR
jgi:hypothetical protein